MALPICFTPARFWRHCRRCMSIFARCGAGAIYTDVWTSMGQEQEAAIRREVFRPYQVNVALLAEAPSHAVVMHCLPAHRGEEITEDVFESDHLLVFEEAENRLHAQKALLVFTMI